MNGDNPRMDERVELVRHRLSEDLVDEHGDAAPADVVADVVAEKAARLRDAPVQEFVPLLVEHQARDELRKRGLRRELPDELQEPGEHLAENRAPDDAGEAPPH